MTLGHALLVEAHCETALPPAPADATQTLVAGSFVAQWAELDEDSETPIPHQVHSSWD